jgi:hypothetical protein
MSGLYPAFLSCWSQWTRAAGQEDADGHGGPGGYSASQARYIEPQCLDVATDGNYNQRWVVHDAEAGSDGFMLRSQDPAYEGKCLEAAEDGLLSMQDCQDLHWPRQVWYVPQLQDAILGEDEGEEEGEGEGEEDEDAKGEE